jgi:hypothetical protein
MNKLFIGKINLSKIDKERLFKGQKGTYLDIAVWFSEEPDQFGNNLSIQQSTKKDEPKIYIGEAKFYVPKDKEPPQAKDEFQGSAAKEAIINKAKEMDFNDDGMPF